MAFRLISLILSLSLFCQQAGIAYASGELNLANYLSQAHSAIVQPDIFQPARLRYISYDSRNNDFKLLLDKGDAKLNNATQELFNYFLIGLALPNDTFWVNLRPDAPENIIDPLLEKTDIGKIFLEADLQLKKDTASLTSPQNPEGKAYWDKLYKKAGELFGTENITIPTITRPWIVPNEVIVRETEDSAYIYKATLKVMLEADYLIGRGGSRTAPTPEQYAFSDPRLKELNEYSSQIIRETIIPKLTKEINSSKRYAKLRQVYYSLVLARWFKQKYSSPGSIRAQGSSAPINSYIGLIDSGNLSNLVSPKPCDKQAYFQAYQKSFKNGEYNLKETIASPSGQSIRNYISGGIGMNVSSPAVVKISDSSVVTDLLLSYGKIYDNLNKQFVSSAIEDNEYLHIEMKKIFKAFDGGYATAEATAVKIINLIIFNPDHPFFYSLGQDIFEEAAKVNPKFVSVFDAINKTIERYGRQKDSEGRSIITQDGLREEIMKCLNASPQIVSAYIDEKRKVISMVIDNWLNNVDNSYLKKNCNPFPSYKLAIVENRVNTILQLVGWLKQRIDVLVETKMAEENLKNNIRYNRATRNAFEDAITEFRSLFDELKEENKKIEDALLGEGKQNGGATKTSGSPIVFWDGEIQKKRTLSYVPGDKLGAKRREEILENKASFMEGMTQFGPDVIKDFRFAFSGDVASNGAVLEGYIVISHEDNSALAINAVAGATQWIKTAIIIAGIQELVDKLRPGQFMQLNNVLKDEPYQTMKLQGLIMESEESKEREKVLYVNHLKEYGKISKAAAISIIKEFYNNYIPRLVEDREAYDKLINNVSASPPGAVADSPLGGIDFIGRVMRLKIERVGSFADLRLVLPEVKNAKDIDLDKEFKQIEAIASSGIVPNSRRILELFSACYGRREFGQRLPQVISCLKASSAIQENLGLDSDDDFRLALIVPEALTDGS